MYFTLTLLILAACQKKQYFSSSPEIDQIKKGNEAYFKGDWATLRSLYADTAQIWVNTWHENSKGQTPDEYIEGLKGGLANMSNYKEGNPTIYEMVVTDDGTKWVHCWMHWTGSTKGGKEVKSVVHATFSIKDNKVIYQGNIYDSLPGYLAMQPDSTQNK